MTTFETQREDGVTPPTAADAIALARRTFTSGRRLEMKTLAAELGVNPATLFRWVGPKSALIGKVMWALTEPTIDRAIARAEGVGAVRVANACGDFAATAIDAHYFREFIRSEPNRALEVMTTRQGGVKLRIVAKFEDFLRAEAENAGVKLPLPIPDLAFLLVRIAESFVYSDVIGGSEPDAGKVRLASAALLGVADHFSSDAS